MNDTDYIRDSRKSLKLLKISERSTDEIKLLREKFMSSDPLGKRQTLTEEISGKDPFKNIIPNYNYKKQIIQSDNNEWLEHVVHEKLNISERNASIKRKKGENETTPPQPKFRWEKSQTTQNGSDDLRQKNSKNTKKSSLNNPKNDKEKLRASIKESLKEIPKKEEKKEIVVVSSYNDLPKKFQREVENAKIPIESIEQNFFCLLNILHFCDHGTVFVLKDGDSERRTTSQKKAVHFDISSKEVELLNSGNPKDLYKLGPQLGKGGFGTVFEAKPKKKQKDKIAIKIISHSNPHQKKYNLREVEFLVKYKHTNIVNLLGAYNVNEELWIVMEHLRGGTLTEARNSHRFSEAQIGYISKHLLIGINFLHNNGLIHRDIKSQNVMMAVDGTIKLIDFGLCHDTKVFGNVVEMVGSPYWMPPEMIKGETHSFVADIWSFAICILELANNEAPNRDNKLKAMYTVATVGLPNPLSKPERWSHNFKWFISACLKTNPSERASAADLLVHPFFKDVASRSVMTEIFSSIFITKALNTFL